MKLDSVQTPVGDILKFRFILGHSNFKLLVLQAFFGKKILSDSKKSPIFQLLFYSKMAHFLPPELVRQVNKLEWPYWHTAMCTWELWFKINEPNEGYNKTIHHFNPFTPGDLLSRPALSGPVKLLKITLEWSINSQDICRGVIDRVLMNISSSNIFWIFLLLERYHQNCQAVLAATGMNGLKRWEACLLHNLKSWYITLTLVVSNLANTKWCVSMKMATY